MRQNKLNKAFFIGSTILTLLLVSFAVLYKVDVLSIRMWDESRNACNAIEMYYNHHFSVRYFMGQPDMWEIKPPLLTWLQVGAFNVFGINELSIRLPSALAVISISAFFFYFFKKENYLIAVFASLILVTCPGYMGDHMARFGDHDALLTLFSTLSALYFYKTIKSEGYSRNWFLFWLFLLLAWYTKSITSLFFVPAWMLYLLFEKKLIWTLKQKSFYFGLIVFLVAVCGYYWYHEIQTPGYFKEVWNNELFNRFFGKKVNYVYEKHSYFYYFKGLTTRLGIWVWLSILLFIPFKKSKFKSLFRYCLFLFFITLIVLSFGTKNFWYDAVFFPIYALLIALQLVNVWQYLSRFKWAMYAYPLVIVALFIGSSKSVENLILNPRDNTYDATLYNLGYLLRDAEWVKSQKKVNILYDHNEAPIYFYFFKLKQEGYNVTFTNHPKGKELNEDAYVCADPLIVELMEGKGFKSEKMNYSCWKMVKE